MTDQDRLIVEELLLARAVIHELAWGDVVISEHLRLRAALEAWGKADKVENLQLRQALRTPPST